MENSKDILKDAESVTLCVNNKGDLRVIGPPCVLSLDPPLNLHIEIIRS